MRTYRVEVNGRTYVVSLEQTSKNRVRCTLDNEVFEGESIANGDLATWIFRTGKAVVRAHSRISHGDKVDVWIGGLPFPTTVQVISTADYATRAQLAGERRVGGEIRALMPGRITSILVKEGDPVEAGAPLLILEAMKMQNEITSPIAGRVKSIRVQEGSTIKKDVALIVVE